MALIVAACPWQNGCLERTTAIPFPTAPLRLLPLLKSILVWGITLLRGPPFLPAASTSHCPDHMYSTGWTGQVAALSRRQIERGLIATPLQAILPATPAVPLWIRVPKTATPAATRAVPLWIRVPTNTMVILQAAPKQDRLRRTARQAFMRRRSCSLPGRRPHTVVCEPGLHQLLFNHRLPQDQRRRQGLRQLSSSVSRMSALASSCSLPQCVGSETSTQSPHSLF